MLKLTSPSPLPAAVSLPRSTRARPTRASPAYTRRFGRLLRWVGLGVLTALCVVLPLQADEEDEARQRLNQIRAEIQQLQQERDSGDSERNAIVSEQRRVEVEIGQLRKEVRGLDMDLEQVRGELAILQAQSAQGEAQLALRQEQLGDQLALAYRLGRQSRLKLLFNLEDPALSSRLLAYHGYFSRAQSARINAVLEQLEQLQQLAQQVLGREQELSTLREERNQHLQRLESAYSQREQLLKTLDRQLATLSARIGELRANQRDLERLLQRLQNALTDIPDNLGAQPFRDLLGKLKPPVSGKMALRFGQPQQDGRPGTGVVFNARAGAEVQSVGYGRVAFADWLRGYGLLMIIDHGDGYMSLYGRNESLLQEAGDWVEAGQVVAVVGQGNLDAPAGLYFELRKDGQAVDPEHWFRSRK